MCLTSPPAATARPLPQPITPSEKYFSKTLFSIFKLRNVPLFQVLEYFRPSLEFQFEKLEYQLHSELLVDLVYERF